MSGNYIFVISHFEERPGGFYIRRYTAESCMKEGDRLYRVMNGQDWDDRVYLGTKTEGKVSL